MKGNDFMKKLIALILAIIVVLSVSVTAFAAPADLITKEEAKEIALNHAGYNADEVKFTKAKLDRDDGRYEYEIEFRTDDYIEYEYSINAENGRILEFDREYDAPDRYEGFFLFRFFKNLFAKIF